MLLPAMLFNLCLGLLCAAFLFRAVRRYERRADAIVAKLDQDEELSIQKWEIARDEIILSMQEKIDRAIAKMHVQMVPHPGDRDTAPIAPSETPPPAFGA
jgi:hypothetical protein